MKKSSLISQNYRQHNMASLSTFCGRAFIKLIFISVSHAELYIPKPAEFETMRRVLQKASEDFDLNLSSEQINKLSAGIVLGLEKEIVDGILKEHPSLNRKQVSERVETFLLHWKAKRSELEATRARINNYSTKQFLEKVKSGSAIETRLFLRDVLPRVSKNRALVIREFLIDANPRSERQLRLLLRDVLVMKGLDSETQVDIVEQLILHFKERRLRLQPYVRWNEQNDVGDETRDYDFLSYAVYSKNVITIEKLLQAGTDPNRSIDEIKGPLGAGRGAEDLAVLKCLLDNTHHRLNLGSIRLLYEVASSHKNQKTMDMLSVYLTKKLIHPVHELDQKHYDRRQ